MRYRNVKTGAVIDSPFVIKGKFWIVEEKKKQVKSLGRHTKSELYVMLQDKEIDYKPEQTKKELIKLLGGD